MLGQPVFIIFLTKAFLRRGFLQVSQRVTCSSGFLAPRDLNLAELLVKRFKRRSALVFVGEKNAELGSASIDRSLKRDCLTWLLDLREERVGNSFLQVRAIVEKGVLPARGVSSNINPAPGCGIPQRRQ